MKQVASRKLGFPLDNITVETRVTCLETDQEVKAVGSMPPHGALVHGFVIEGAKWKCCYEVTRIWSSTSGRSVSLDSR